ncbi:hypothetical protein, partial [Cerasicoccus frondis]|uniref:hypothetical protein n=1 Tax=Cerasicoccus frondis TaxID=490090 RepID=UPI002852BDA3
ERGGYMRKMRQHFSSYIPTGYAVSFIMSDSNFFLCRMSFNSWKGRADVQRIRKPKVFVPLLPTFIPLSNAIERTMNPKPKIHRPQQVLIMILLLFWASCILDLDFSFIVSVA